MGFGGGEGIDDDDDGIVVYVQGIFFMLDAKTKSIEPVGMLGSPMINVQNGGSAFLP